MIKEIIEKEFPKWAEDGDSSEWEEGDVKAFAEIIAKKVLEECIEGIELAIDRVQTDLPPIQQHGLDFMKIGLGGAIKLIKNLMEIR